MIGKITNIREVENIGQETCEQLGRWQKMDGYEISTEDKKIFVLIGNSQSCCEDWGYFSSEDNLTDFIGADLLEVNLTDTERNHKKLKEVLEYGLDDGGIQFVDFVTTKGVFQLAVYNAHNGYYGHDILIASGDKVLSDDCL